MIKQLMFLLLICVIAISGCTDAGTDEEATTDETAEDAAMDDTATEDSTMDDAQSMVPDAATLFTMFTEEDNYNEWSIWPGTEAMMEGNGVHGDYVSIYVSENALSAAEVGGEMMPYETFVLKEGFNSDEELIGIYLMYKAEDFDAQNNDWFWATYSADGTVKSEGKIGGCISCHEGKDDVDYIFVNA